MLRSTRTLQTTAVIALIIAANTPASNAAEAEEPNRGTAVVAAVQINGYDKGDLPRDGYDPTIPMLPYIERAGQEKVDLIVFPEYVLGHIPVPGPSTNKIAAAAAANGVYVIVGCWETFKDATYANTALVFDRGGKIAGKYRKTHAAIDNFDPDSPPWTKPPPNKNRDWFLKNDPEWTMEAGDNLPVFECDFGKVGIMTCYDGWFPEPARVLSLRGAELIVWINGRGGSVEDFIMKSTMFQSHVAMVAANQAYGSGTMIGDWPARIVARCPDKTEAYISGTINLAKIRHVRNNSRNFRQRRPDLYNELVAPQGQRQGHPSK
jgi:predicted amidohydrolase